MKNLLQVEDSAKIYISNYNISNNRNLNNEILLSYTGYVQDKLVAAHLNMTLSYSVLANDCKIMNPILILTSYSFSTIWQ